MNKITAIITNYNQGKFFRTALQSLLSQTRLPDQIIAVDDCSTDDSAKVIAKEIKDLDKGIIPIEFIVRATNGKPAGARNSGIEKATGDIICFLDVDDIYYSEKIAKSVYILDKYPEVGLVYTDYDVMDIINNTQKREFKHPYEFNYLWQTCIVSTNSIVRKSVLDKVGKFDEKLFGVEDYNMWIRIAKVSLLYHIPEALFMYRLHGGNITMNHAQSMHEQIIKFKQEMANA